MFKVDEIIRYCCSDEVFPGWFRTDRAFDRQMRKRFISFVMLASNDELGHWPDSAQNLAMIVILLDRLSRACFRHTQLEFASEKKALEAANTILSSGKLDELPLRAQILTLFPFMASENKDNLDKAIERLRIYLRTPVYEAEQELLCKLITLCERNVLLLDEFRRFPHRAKAKRYQLTSKERIFVDETVWQEWL